MPGGLTVTVPAADAGSVLVLVAEDGTETIIRKSVTADGEVAGLVDGPCTVKVVDNAKTFTDTSGHWAADAIDFASSRELFNLDNVIMTPHMAATTEQSVLNCCTSVANDIVAVCNGQEPKVKAQKPKF